jgi:hypothetical protein
LHDLGLEVPICDPYAQPEFPRWLSLRAGSLALLFRLTLPLVDDLGVVRRVSFVLDPRIMWSMERFVQWRGPAFGNLARRRGWRRASPCPERDSAARPGICHAQLPCDSGPSKRARSSPTL